MRPKVAIQTLLLVAACLFLQNFNVPTDVHPPATRQDVAIGSEKRSNTGVSGVQANFRREGNYKIKKVVLDAGHGGKDPGCIGANAQEKDNALGIILKLGQLIEDNYPDIEVIYTRKEDVFIELYERAAIANRNNADLFISVHCNALSVSSAKGTETYVLGLHKAQHNLEVAKRENASIYLEDNYQQNYDGYDPNSAEAHIFGSVLQSAYLEQSILLAGYVQEEAKNIGGRDDRGVKQAGFLVLRETAMPSVLVEVGYLTHREEEEYLASEEGQQQMAASIFEGFSRYKDRMEENGAPLAGKPQKRENTATVAKGLSKTTETKPAAPKTAPSTLKKSATPQPVAGADKNTEAILVGEAAFNKPKGTAVKVVSPQGGKNAGPSNTSAQIKEPLKNTSPPVAPSVDKNANYRIFLMAHTIPMDRNSGLFALLSEIKEEKRNGKYCYFTGTFATRTEAEKMLPEIRNLGFTTAKIEEPGK